MIAKTKVLNFIKSNYLIIVILAAGFLVRWYGIYFDYPRVDFIWDEIYNVGYLFDIIEQKTIFPNPPSSTYPLALPILIAPVFILRIIYLAVSNGIFNADTLKNFIIDNGIGQIYIISRWYSVAFGTLTIYYIYRISGMLFRNRSSAFYAALVYAFSLIPVFISHWGKHHATMELFIVLSLFFCLLYERSKEKKYLFYSVFSAILAFGTHYVGVTAFIFPFYAYIRNHIEIKTKYIVTLALFAFFSSVFLYLSNFYGIKKMVFDQVWGEYYSKQGLGLFPVGPFERFYYVFRDLFNIDPVFTALSIVLVVLFFRRLVRDRNFQYILVGLAFNYILMVTIITGPQNTRWLLTFATLSVPFFAGLFLEWMLEKKLKLTLALIVLTILVIPSAFISLKWVYALRSDTRVEAEKWIVDNLRSDENIYSFFYTFYAPMSYAAAVWNKENNSMDFRKINNIVKHKDYYVGRGVNLMYDKQNYRYKDLSGKNTKYILVVSPQTDETKEILKNVKRHHQLQLAADFVPSKDMERLNSIYAFELLNNPVNWQGIMLADIAGPQIEIYKVVN